MAKKRPQVALVYDFDGTLSPGNMQEFGFIQATGKTKEEFWNRNRKLSEGKDANGILTYMFLMLEEAKKNNISLTRESFQSFGKNVELFRGVKQWFSFINEYGASIGLDIKHYINSSGLKEMIEGTPSPRNSRTSMPARFSMTMTALPTGQPWPWITPPRRSFSSRSTRASGR